MQYGPFSKKRFTSITIVIYRLFLHCSLLGTFSSEVLFEVWDPCPKTLQTEEESVLASLNDPALAERFLGLGIVSVDELLITPSQR